MKANCAKSSTPVPMNLQHTRCHTNIPMLRGWETWRQLPGRTMQRESALDGERNENPEFDELQTMTNHKRLPKVVGNPSPTLWPSLSKRIQCPGLASKQSSPLLLIHMTHPKLTAKTMIVTALDRFRNVDLIVLDWWHRHENDLFWAPATASFATNLPFSKPCEWNKFRRSFLRDCH